MQPTSATPSKKQRSYFTSLRNAERQRHGEGIDRRALIKKQRQKIAKIFRGFRNGRSEQRKVGLGFTKIKPDTPIGTHYKSVEWLMNMPSLIFTFQAAQSFGFQRCTKGSRS
jgi:hypothetical protein